MEQQFEIKMLTANDINIILAGLQELPLKISAMVFNKIKEQAEAQSQQAAKQQ